MDWTYYIEADLKNGGSIAAGIRMRSWALPLLITFTPALYEIAVGPFFLSYEKKQGVPF